MRRVALALAAVILAACNPSAPGGDNADGGGAFPNLSGAAYRAEAMVTHEDGEPMPMVMVRDGQRLRIEVNSDEGNTVIISNAESGETFVMSQAAGRTMAMRVAAMPSQFEDPTQSWQGELASTSTRTGTCSVAGETGAEWTRTEEGVVKTACVTNDGIILLVTEGGRTVWETTSVQRGPQPADQFVLPPGVEVMDLGNMGGMMEAIENSKGR